MELGFIGLGRMGANMVHRLLLGGHRVVAYNRSPDKTREVADTRRRRSLLHRGADRQPGRVAQSRLDHGSCR